MSKLTHLRKPAASAVIALAMASALAGCQKEQKTAAPLPAPAPVEVTVLSVEKRSVPVYADLTGRTAAFRIAEVRPQVGGIIVKRHFQEGSAVKAGQLLYQIDSAPFEAALASAEANHRKAEALTAAARPKAARYKALAASDAVSRQTYEDAERDLKQAEAQAAAAKADVRSARISLGYTKVTAPIAGRIGKSSVTEGALVGAGQATALSVIQQIDPIYVDVTQSVDQLMALRRDIAAGNVQGAMDGKAPVSLVIDGDKIDRTGHLQFSDVTVDQGTGSVGLRALFPNPDQDLLPGLFVRARVEQGLRAQSVLIPQRAVTRGRDGKAQVWVVGSDNKVSQRAIETDKAIGGDWLVTSGLETGDRVVVAGLQKIRPGADVMPVPAETPSSR